MNLPSLLSILVTSLLTVAGCASENELLARRYTALIRACEKGDQSRAMDLLREGVEPNGADIVTAGPMTRVEYLAHLRDAPIVCAAQNGDVELVRMLLAHGANPNWCCCSCVTALHRAIIKEHIDVVRLLLANGADVSINYDGKISTVQLAKRVGNKIIVEIIERDTGAVTRQADEDNT